MFSAPQNAGRREILLNADHHGIGQSGGLRVKLRTDVAQTPVSIDGKMLRMTFFPAKSLEGHIVRSVLVSLKSGALLPTAGSVRRVDGVALNLMSACGSPLISRFVSEEF
jgi:hypothetical protein